MLSYRPPPKGTQFQDMEHFETRLQMFQYHVCHGACKVQQEQLQLSHAKRPRNSAPAIPNLFVCFGHSVAGEVADIASKFEISLILALLRLNIRRHVRVKTFLPAPCQAVSYVKIRMDRASREQKYRINSHLV